MVGPQLTSPRRGTKHSPLSRDDKKEIFDRVIENEVDVEIYSW